MLSAQLNVALEKQQTQALNLIYGKEIRAAKMQGLAGIEPQRRKAAAKKFSQKVLLILSTAACLKKDRLHATLAETKLCTINTRNHWQTLTDSGINH